jgi:hypothetical protein
LQRGEDYLVFELFSNRKCHGLSPWLGRPRLLQLTFNQGARGDGGSSELGLTAAPEDSSVPAVVRQREGNTGIPARASSGLRRRWRGGAMEAMNGSSLSLA